LNALVGYSVWQFAHTDVGTASPPAVTFAGAKSVGAHSGLGQDHFVMRPTVPGGYDTFL
jgi:hypothetical protein